MTPDRDHEPEPPAPQGRVQRPTSDLVGDGLPALPTGEPVLARWFVILMLVLVPVGIAVIVWVFLALPSGEPAPAAARRPPGTASVTHDRGDAALNATTDVEPGPGCAEGVALIGDAGARAAARRALSATCQLLLRGDLAQAATGLERLAAMDGAVRFAVFELTGVDSSTRVEDGRPVVELNARFQFEDATQAAPFVVHELHHLGGDWPGQAVTADEELAAMQAQATACGRLVFQQQPPRGCVDAAELADATDARSQLRDSGYGPAG